jgi:hypothetical protein
MFLSTWRSAERGDELKEISTVLNVLSYHILTDTAATRTGTCTAFGRSNTEITSSNPARNMDVCP